MLKYCRRAVKHTPAEECWCRCGTTVKLSTACVFFVGRRLTRRLDIKRDQRASALYRVQGGVVTWWLMSSYACVGGAEAVKMDPLNCAGGKAFEGKQQWTWCTCFVLTLGAISVRSIAHAIQWDCAEFVVAFHWPSRLAGHLSSLRYYCVLLQTQINCHRTQSVLCIIERINQWLHHIAAAAAQPTSLSYRQSYRWIQRNTTAAELDDVLINYVNYCFFN